MSNKIKGIIATEFLGSVREEEVEAISVLEGSFFYHKEFLGRNHVLTHAPTGRALIKSSYKKVRKAITFLKRNLTEKDIDFLKKHKNPKTLKLKASKKLIKILRQVVELYNKK